MGCGIRVMLGCMPCFNFVVACLHLVLLDVGLFFIIFAVVSLAQV